MDSGHESFGDREMQRLFQNLREHVVEILADFTQRVMIKVDALVEETQSGPTVMQLVGDGAVEATNAIIGTIKGHLDDSGAVESDSTEEDEDE